jgi:carboxymethylenebutenolidase
MNEEKVTVRTADGDCPVYVFAPDDGGKHPAVIMFTDAFGIRPASLEMGRRLASNGYVVLMPDIFYRYGDYDPLDPKEVLASPDGFASLRPIMSSTDTARAARDTQAFLDYLASREDVADAGVGVTGYCMGGTLAFTSAGTYPDRISALATFHTSRLITDDELNPARVAKDIRARVLIAGADHDAGYPPEMAEELDRMLTDAGVEHTMEVYPEALHGWTQTDFPVYDEAAAERHWTELVELLDTTLKPAAG